MAQPKPIDHTTGGHYQLPRTTAPILTPEESRQGVESGHVLMVLVTGLVLALIAFVILYATAIV